MSQPAAMRVKAEKVSASINSDSVGYSATWKQGFWARFPWLGIVCLIFTLLCLVFNIIILVVSDGMVVNQWGVQPAVLIAISTALGNGLLRMALVQGGMITWWRNAIYGCSISRLSQLWMMYNENPFLLFKKFHILGLAMIAVFLAPVDSPLYQRAQTVETRTDAVHKDLPVKIAQQLPLGYTGVLRNHGIPTLEAMTDSFRQNYLAYSNREPMYLDTPDHPDANFTATVKAAGFSINCTQRSEEKNFGWTFRLGKHGTANMDNVSDHRTTGQSGPDEKLFETKFYWDVGLPSVIRFNASWKEDGDCVAPLKFKECTLQLATLKYGVDVQQSKMSFDSSLNDIGMDNKSVADTYTYRGPEVDQNSTLGGLYMVGQNFFTSQARIRQDGALKTLSIDTKGSLVQQAANNLGNATGSLSGYGACNATFKDPTSMIVSGLQELMFRTSLAAANDTKPLWRGDNGKPISLRQTVHASMKELSPVFKLHPGFLGGAAAVSFVCFILVAWTFWGWWDLGQMVTMNPIFLSKAFGSPLLDEDGDRDSEKSAVRYGPVVISTGREGEAQGDWTDTSMTQESLRPRFTFVDRPGGAA